MRQIAAIALCALVIIAQCEGSHHRYRNHRPHHNRHVHLMHLSRDETAKHTDTTSTNPEIYIKLLLPFKNTFPW
uniref:Secreted protein n=1 Tax=Steinernema glaseri TaxID=37863 RepID=A0A1I7Y2D4_9BILA